MKFRHVQENFIDAVANESGEAESELLKVKWNEAYSRDSIYLKACLENI